MNHCPVYTAIGGHAYGWVYPGPIGAVLTPALIGVAQGRAPAQRLHLLRALRGGMPDEDPAAGADAALARGGVLGWRHAAALRAGPQGAGRRWPSGRASIIALARVGMPLLARSDGARGAFRRLPFAGGWTKHRDLAAPQGRTFQALWADHKAGVPR